MAANAEEMAGLLRAVLDGKIEPANGERVAIIGAGPAGLSAAHDLALGYIPARTSLERAAAWRVTLTDWA